MRINYYEVSCLIIWIKVVSSSIIVTETNR